MGIIASNKTVDKTIIKGEETFKVKLELTSAPNIVDKPKDILLVLDESSSMTGVKFDAMVEAATNFVDIITDSTNGVRDASFGGETQMGVEGFSTSATIVTPIVGNPDTVKKGILSLSPSGSTNHEAAFIIGMSAFKNPNKDKVMILLTDGVSNTGKEGYAAAEKAKAEGIEIYCLGYGTNVHMPALYKWASSPNRDHVLVAPQYQDIKKMFEDLAVVISEPKATNVSLIDEVNSCFEVVSVNAPIKGGIEKLSNHSVKWTVPEIGGKGEETISAEFTVKHTGKCSGIVPVNDSFVYTDNENNTINLPEPTIEIVDTSGGTYQEECPKAYDIVADGCKDYVTFNAGDITIDGLGRVLEISANIKDVCPNKSVALAVLLTEVDGDGVEYSRGMKTLVVPAHTDTACKDILVKCIKFVLPEALDRQGAPTSMCNDRVFKVRFITNYLDSDYECCKL